MSLLQFLQNSWGFFNPFTAREPAVNAGQVGLMDIYMELILDIITWKDTAKTITTLFVGNLITLLLLTLEIRFYGTLAIIALNIFVFDFLNRETLYSNYTGEYGSIISDIKSVAKKCFSRLWLLRHESAIVFYPLVCLGWWALYYISRHVSQTLIFYLIFVLSIFCCKVLMQLPESVTCQIKDFWYNLSTTSCAEVDLIPYIQKKDLNKRDADTESLLTDRTTDSVTISWASGITSMPSYLEIEDSVDNILEEDDLLPNTKPGVSYTPGESSTSESDSENKEIKFDSDHFNASSSDDDPLTKDLAFKHALSQSHTQPGMLQSMIATSANLMGGMFRSKIVQEPKVMDEVPSDSDSSNDFELVDHNDVPDYKKQN
ncbi:hypothetical protein ABEB36_012382 [Hypothenemus hampei]|uniref:Uncharacterized protein n=1 Tax=Hypothenemus hampei TaxID=57062 RepID=A0ABD1EB09_HYPHA